MRPSTNPGIPKLSASWSKIILISVCHLSSSSIYWKAPSTPTTKHVMQFWNDIQMMAFLHMIKWRRSLLRSPELALSFIWCADTAVWHTLDCFPDLINVWSVASQSSVLLQENHSRNSIQSWLGHCCKCCSEIHLVPGGSLIDGIRLWKSSQSCTRIWVINLAAYDNFFHGTEYSDSKNHFNVWPIWTIQ